MILINNISYLPYLISLRLVSIRLNIYDFRKIIAVIYKMISFNTVFKT